MALLDKKAQDLCIVNLEGRNAIADAMVIATGTSDRHAISLAQDLQNQAKNAGFPPLSVEGEQGGQWVLVDLGDVLIHIFQEETRKLYNLEKLWAHDFDKEASSTSSNRTA